MTSRILALEDKYRAFYQDQVVAEYKPLLEKLDSHYLQALRRAASEASLDSQEHALLLREMERFESQRTLTARQNEDRVSPTLVKLKGIYKQEILTISRQRATNLEPIIRGFLSELTAIEQELLVSDNKEGLAILRRYRQTNPPEKLFPAPAQFPSSSQGLLSHSYGAGMPRTNTRQPDTPQPDTSQPDTSQPDTSQPDTSQPDTSQPDTSQPDTSHTFIPLGESSQSPGSYWKLIVIFSATTCLLMFTAVKLLRNKRRSP